MKTKKVKSSGRFGVRYGIKPRRMLSAIEEKQRKKQVCPFCKKPKLVRLSKGIWNCKRCSKKFASDTFYLE